VSRNFDSAGAFMYDLSLSADGQTIAAGGLDGVLRLWSVGDGKSIGTFATPTGQTVSNGRRSGALKGKTGGPQAVC
jgi:WD40 repeat protein